MRAGIDRSLQDCARKSQINSITPSLLLREVLILEKIVHYGERGVVDTIIHYLVENQQSKRFLQSVKWGDNAKPEWIESIESTTWILEVSLNGTSGFGDPDIILVCENFEGKPYFVFIEAKVNTYLKSAAQNSKGMIKGYNSKINGQLSLKYRFCKAVEGWTGEGRIIESESLFTHYNIRLDENQKRPRRLAKPQVLELLRKHRFKKLDIDRCFYVAMTWDREPGPIIDLDEDITPLFLSESGEELHSYTKAHLGWIGYGVIDRTFELDESFRETLSTMVEIYPEPL